MRELQASLDSREFSEWIAYYSIEPWGEESAWLRHGINTSALVNMQIAKGKTTSPIDYMPYAEEKQTGEATEAYVKQMAEVWNRGKHSRT